MSNSGDIIEKLSKLDTEHEDLLLEKEKLRKMAESRARTLQLLYGLLVIQVITLVAVIFNVFGARQFFGFLYLTFLPGFLIVKIFDLGKIGLIETVLFSVGISLTFLMFLGLLLNATYPALSLSNPLSAFSIVASVSTIVLILYLILYNRRRLLPDYGVVIPKWSPGVPLLISVPFLTLLGAELANVLGNTIVLMVLVIVVCFVVLSVFLKGLIPSEIYPLAIMAISFFLLFQTSLISNFLIGADVHTEYYFAQLTSINSFWNRTIPHSYNAMLSVTILPVIFSRFTDLDLNWVFKVVYPLIYSLVPLALYKAYQKVSGSLIAFLSVFFFMSIDTFYLQMLGLAREMIGELFLALLIILMLEEKISLTKRRLLFMLFSAALIVSHYSTAYFLAFSLLVTFLIADFFKRRSAQARRGQKSIRVITGSMILGFLALVFLWNLFITPATFDSLATFLNYLYENIRSYIPPPGVSGLVPTYISPLHEISKYLFYVPQLLIIVGIIGLLRKRKESSSPEFSSMALASMAVLLMCIFLPAFATGLNMTRFYHLALFFLAPLCAAGGLIVLSSLARIKSRFSSAKNKLARVTRSSNRKIHLFLIAVLLVSYFLFQVGFIYEIAGDKTPTSISLSKDRMNSWTIYLNQLYVDQQEASAVEWFAHYNNNESKVYAASEGTTYLTSYGLTSPERLNFIEPTSYVDISYIYFDRLNVVNNIVVGGTVWNSSDFSSLLNRTNKIYCNGASDIYSGPGL